MKQLTIDWNALEMAFDDDADEFGVDHSCYFDVKVGKVVIIDAEIHNAVSSITDELDEYLEERAVWTENVVRGKGAFQQLSSFEQSNVLAAVKIEYGDSSQFEEIPTFDSRESFEWMRHFIETVNDESIRGKLCRAISERKPFRSFRNVLAEDRQVERQWLMFESEEKRKTVIAWLQSIGVEPANPDSATYNPPPLPDLRNILFAEVRQFVRNAREMEGVRRIALIGSLATSKEFPKDIDLLATVSDDCDLAPLARLGRQISGRMNCYQAGVDVFLASESGDYLGRTCPWKNCGPSFRKSCDAIRCGNRSYLHDDFNAVRLTKELIAQPLVLLWPCLAEQCNTPQDVQVQLIEQLTQDEAT